MSDAEIFDVMRDRQLNAYLEEQDRFSKSEEGAYDSCMEEADAELQHHYDEIMKVAKSLSSRYGFGIGQIIEEMVVPSLEVTK